DKFRTKIFYPRLRRRDAGCRKNYDSLLVCIRSIASVGRQALKGSQRWITIPMGVAFRFSFNICRSRIHFGGGATSSARRQGLSDNENRPHQGPYLCEGTITSVPSIIEGWERGRRSPVPGSGAGPGGQRRSTLLESGASPGC